MHKHPISVSILNLFYIVYIIIKRKYKSNTDCAYPYKFNINNKGNSENFQAQVHLESIERT